jgi:tRNA (guanine37-N1)-methyltransferase
MIWSATIVTLYPDMFPGPLGASLAGRALRDGAWSLAAVNPRDFARDRHRSVDDTPAGGGPGMVLRADILAAALESVTAPGPRLLLTPRGRPIDQARIRALAAGPGAVLVCGRFEGIDQRLVEARGLEEVSVGDVVLSGGEIAALVVLDACVRLLPGVMGAEASGTDESFETGLLEYPHYTRPSDWEGRAIPPVLASGDHAAIARWRRQAALAATRARRPDLWAKYVARLSRRVDKPREFE